MALTLGGIAWVIWEREHAKQAHVEGSMLVGVVAGVLAAVGQAGGYVLSKMALSTGLDPLSATVIRIVAAAVGIWLLAALQRDVRRSLGALRDRRGSAFMVGGAFFGPFLGVTLSLTALKYIEAGVAASITAIYPVLTLLLSSRFHGERLTLRTLAGALVAVAGVVVLFLRWTGTPPSAASISRRVPQRVAAGRRGGGGRGAPRAVRERVPNRKVGWGRLGGLELERGVGRD